MGLNVLHIFTRLRVRWWIWRHPDQYRRALLTLLVAHHLYITTTAKKVPWPPQNFFGDPPWA